MIEVQELVYDYPGLRALDRVSFALEPRSITALVGPNGAGKSTLMRCIAALDRPFLGRVTIGGEDVQNDPRAIHHRIGYLPDFFGLYDRLTVEQCLRYRAAAQAIPAGERDAALVWAAERVQLGSRMQQLAGELSRGLRQRLAIAQAIVHKPEVVLLDEPASGLDPEARARLAEVLLDLRAEGMTLLVSSHILSELQDYSTHMLILDSGKLVDHRPIGETPERAQAVTILVALSAPDDRLPSILAAVPGAGDVTYEAPRARFLFDGPADARRALLAHLVEAGLPVCEFAVERENLQEAYLARLREAGIS